LNTECYSPAATTPLRDCSAAACRAFAGLERIRVAMVAPSSMEAMGIASDGFMALRKPWPNTSWPSDAPAGGRLDRWQMATQTGAAGFTVYAGAHTLNDQVIPVHRSTTYRYTVGAHLPLSRQGALFSLHVLLRNGLELIASVQR